MDVVLINILLENISKSIKKKILFIISTAFNQRFYLFKQFNQIELIQGEDEEIIFKEYDGHLGIANVLKGYINKIKNINVLINYCIKKNLYISN